MMISRDEAEATWDNREKRRAYYEANRETVARYGTLMHRA